MPLKRSMFVISVIAKVNTQRLPPRLDADACACKQKGLPTDFAPLRPLNLWNLAKRTGASEAYAARRCAVTSGLIAVELGTLLASIFDKSLP